MGTPVLHNLGGKYHLYTNEEGSLTMSTDLIADIIVHRLRPKWRFEPLAKQWYHFDGNYWKVSHSGYKAIIREVLEVKAALRGGCSNFNKSLDASFAKTIQGKVEADEIVQIAVEDMDKDPTILNTPAGIIDLQTGRLDKPDPDKLCFQITGVAPEDDEDFDKCPLYDQQLELVSAGNGELRQYFEDLSGYLLTGYISEQEFYSFYGRGDNGKGVLTKLWGDAMGTYAHTATAGQFSANNDTKHPEQDMRCMGKRLVLAEEIGSWDINKLKRFTDGGKISAREMHGKSTEFVPRCKLVFVSNVKPKLTTNDWGLERRLRLIEFSRRITEEEKDKTFIQRISPELPYILNRMVLSAVRYMSTRKLHTPQIVRDKSKEYFNSENVVGAFLDECCTPTQNSAIVFGEFYERLQLWCGKAGFEYPTKRKAQQLLENMGYTRGKGADLRMIPGLEWTTAAVEPTAAEYNAIHADRRFID